MTSHFPASPDPAAAALGWARVVENWPADFPPMEQVVAGFADGGAGLAHLLAVSPVSVDKLVSDPAALVWLADATVHAEPRSGRRMRADYQAAAGTEFDPKFSTLRKMKGREMLRLALRDVADWAGVEEITSELTQLAELCVGAVTEGWLAELTRRWGEPGTGFAVLGMGKFGGQELNYSSDIDVIFFYGESGQVRPGFSRQEFFARLGEKIVGTFTEPGLPLFRMDLRLRPEGQSGPVVRSLDSMEHYYAAFGETWERMALIKARLVAGDAELGYEFSQRLQTFIFPRAVSPEMLDEIRAVKGRIEREVVGEARLRRHVKLGYGGIREIEFTVQALQLLHGARHAFLQERSTLRTLRLLCQLDLLPREDMEDLSVAYRWLRTVEHRLQIEQEAQTHTLPEDAAALEKLARSLDRAAGLAGFQATLERHTRRVREVFDKIITGGEAALTEEADLSFLNNQRAARQALADMGDPASGGVGFSPRTRKLFTKLEPLLLDQLRHVADPDQALTGLVRFAERYGSRGHLYETLLASPRVLELLVKLFDASRCLTELVVRSPQFFEEVARDGLGETRGVAEWRALLEVNPEGLDWRDHVRVFRRAGLLRVALKELLGVATLREVQGEFSALAEACVLFCQERLGLETLTVVAMGKFGGQELGYGADLDVVFTGPLNADAPALIRALSERRAEGIVFPMDARLRPEGEKGTLVCPFSTYADYFDGRAQLWEMQALTRARPISGPQQREFMQVAQEAWRAAGERADLFDEIKAMLARVVRDRAGGDDFAAFKTGSGGLMQIEFFTQANQMRHGVWEPNTLSALDALASAGVIAATRRTALAEAFLFLRQVEAALRRIEDQGVSKLPDDNEAQRCLARRCGFADWAAFQVRYAAARETAAREAALP